MWRGRGGEEKGRKKKMDGRGWRGEEAPRKGKWKAGHEQRQDVAPATATRARIGREQRTRRACLIAPALGKGGWQRGGSQPGTVCRNS